MRGHFAVQLPLLAVSSEDPASQKLPENVAEVGAFDIIFELVEGAQRQQSGQERDADLASSSPCP